MSESPLLITGSSGFIGGILARDLCRDYEVRGFDVRASADAVVETTRGSIADLEALEQAMDGVAAVIHLAADADPEATWDDVLHANIVGTRNVYEAAAQAGVRRMVFASSNHASRLDTESGLFASTHRPPAAVNLYGVSKAFGETLGHQYVHARGLSVICLRIGWLNAEDDRTLRPSDIDATTSPMWISHRDLATAFRCALSTSIDFGVFYAMSSAARDGWDLADAERRLGYRPQD